jgi:two-component system, OmpR family, alkaline phosphatase synthesis response regulator PhoP
VSTRARVLLAEDEPGLVLTLTDRLSAEGYRVEAVGTGNAALERGTGDAFDIILLDVMLPGRDGFDVCRTLRQRGVAAPILMLTARGQVVDRVVGLRLGADDYLTKPFHAGELLARIRAVLRRAAHEEHPPSRITAGDLVIDLASREVRRGEEQIHLTRTEFDLLHELVTHAEKVLTYSYLLDAVWGPGYDDIHLVQVHVGNLRRKIERRPAGTRRIVPVPAVGYRFRGDV